MAAVRGTAVVDTSRGSLANGVCGVVTPGHWARASVMSRPRRKAERSARIEAVLQADISPSSYPGHEEGGAWKSTSGPSWDHALVATCVRKSTDRWARLTQKKACGCRALRPTSTRALYYKRLP